MANVADRMARAVKEKKSHVCIGLDPRIEQIPEHIKMRALREYGNTPEGVTSAITDFTTSIIDKTLDVAAVYKPQIAFYEQYGEPGIRAFRRTAAYARNQGAQTVVIEDGKRNDIGETTDAYADGHIGRVKLLTDSFGDFDSPVDAASFDVDMITVSPYLGTDTIKSFLKYCGSRGIFVLCRTSNKSAVDTQDRLVRLYSSEIDFVNERLAGSGLSLDDLPAMQTAKDDDLGKSAMDTEKHAPAYVTMAKKIDEWGRDFVGDFGYSSVGAVVGATYPAEARILRKLMNRTWFLVPGYGAQGGKAEDIPNFVGDDGLGIVVNASRSVIFAYLKSDKYRPEQFADAARDAAILMRNEINTALESAGKRYW